MKHFLFALALVLAAPAAAGVAHAKGWRGVVPLQSTRADVERLLGAPKPEPNLIIYDIENERAFINYSEGACEKGWPYGWDVAPGTVTDISVYLRSDVKLDALKLDLGRFERVQDPHVDGILYYRNAEEGFTVQVNKYEGVVSAFTYYPAAKDEHLQCPREPTGLPEGRPIADSLSKLDVYGDVPFEKEKEKLDYLGEGLKHDRELEGYIIVYAGARARKGEARARAERTKSYVVSTYGVAAERVWAIDGGHREEQHVELYILPRGGAVPLVLPTLRPSMVRIVDDEEGRDD